MNKEYVELIEEINEQELEDTVIGGMISEGKVTPNSVSLKELRWCMEKM